MSRPPWKGEFPMARPGELDRAATEILLRNMRRGFRQCLNLSCSKAAAVGLQHCTDCNAELEVAAEVGER